MNADEYASQQSVIAAQVINYVLTFGKFFKRPQLSTKEWLGLLNLLFPQIQTSREQAATLGRAFYDSQRETAHPQLPRNDRPLEGTEFPTFVQNMEPARKQMSREDSPDHAVATLALRAVREVENAGRQQIIHAVANDPAPEIIRGWARVATGRETCAWCLMLVSRGPVYLSADSAGLDLSDTSATNMIAAGTDVSEFMQEWHEGCDCIVVPVFKTQQWPGKAGADRALELWNDATRTAIQEENDDPDRTHDAGKNKGRMFTRNQRAINALRRSLDTGEIDPSEFAGLAA